MKICTDTWQVPIFNSTLILIFIIKNLMNPRVLLVTGDAGESYEALYALHRFQEAGYEVSIAAPSKRWLHLVIHDFEPGWDTYKEAPGYKLQSDLTFDEVRVEDYEAILVLGGRAPEYLRHDLDLISLIQKFDAQGKWILSLCHGIQVLIAAGLVEGKKLTCYEHVRFELENAGGVWCKPEAVQDGRLITGQTWQSHPAFYQMVFQNLKVDQSVGAEKK